MCNTGEYSRRQNEMRKQNALNDAHTIAAAARSCFTQRGGQVVGADVGTRLGPRYCRRGRRRRGPCTAVRTRCTHARCVRYVQPPRTMGKHLRPLPCDKAAAVPRAEVVRPRAYNTRPSKSLKPV